MNKQRAMHVNTVGINSWRRNAHITIFKSEFLKYADSCKLVTFELGDRLKYFTFPNNFRYFRLVKLRQVLLRIQAKGHKQQKEQDRTFFHFHDGHLLATKDLIFQTDAEASQYQRCFNDNGLGYATLKGFREGGFTSAVRHNHSQSNIPLRNVMSALFDNYLTQQSSRSRSHERFHSLVGYSSIPKGFFDYV